MFQARRWSWWHLIFLSVLVVVGIVGLLSNFDTYKSRHGRTLVHGPLAIEINTVRLISVVVLIVAIAWIARLRGDWVSDRKDWRDFE